MVERNSAIKMILVAALVVVWLELSHDVAFAGAMDGCVLLSDILKGQNCGSADSIQVDVKNSCGVPLKGALIFNQVSGPPTRYSVTMDTGHRVTAFACHSDGRIDKDFEMDR